MNNLSTNLYQDMLNNKMKRRLFSKLIKIERMKATYHHWNPCHKTQNNLKNHV